MAGADFPIEGDKLKKLVKKSRAMPISFGFNAGTSDLDDEYLAAHARKRPEVLGKLALNEGAGTKSAFGTFAVDGSELHLTCLRSTPQLAKKFKKYLKRFKIILNVMVMDPDGNLIDSDVETLDDWFSEEENAEEMAEDAAEAVAEMVEEVMEATDGAIPVAPADTAAAQGDAAALAARLKSIQPKISATPPAIAEKLAAAFKAAVMLVKAGQLVPAGATITQIEAVLDRLATLPAATPAGAPPSAPPDASPLGATPGADPRLARLREVVERLSAQIGGALGTGAGPLLDELARVSGMIDAGEAEAALAALRAAQDRFKSAEAAREKWDKAFAILEGQVNQALSARSVASPDDLRTKWQFAVTVAGEGGWDRALAALPGIVAILRAGPGEGTQATGEPPKDVVAFQGSRILWAGTRDKMLAEAQRLADAIIAQSSEDADAAEIAAAAAEIVQEVQSVDDRLQDVLEAITGAAEGAERTRLRKQAAGLVAEYRALLAGGLFPKIDANPFAPVSVAARARAALDQISRTLA